MLNRLSFGVRCMSSRATKPAMSVAKSNTTERVRGQEWGPVVEACRMEQRNISLGEDYLGCSTDVYDKLEIALLKKAFDAYDLDKNGVLDRNEIKMALRGLNLDDSEANLDRIFHDYDTNSDGVISLQEWLTGESQNLRIEILQSFQDQCS